MDTHTVELLVVPARPLPVAALMGRFVVVSDRGSEEANLQAARNLLDLVAVSDQALDTL